MALWFLYLFALSYLGADAATFTLENRCRNTIWPGIQAGSGKPLLMDGGFQLRPGQAININVPKGWSGRFWDVVRAPLIDLCTTAGGAPPATLAEFTLDSPMDFYDVSLVDGYNMPVSIIPEGGSGSCKAVKCLSDLNKRCPNGLQVRWHGRVIGCKSACMAFNKPEYCCTGAYGNPQTCKPTSYARAFKASCPTAYSYAYDDPTSTFTCKGANYLIRFC
ncbi:hypothetical protein FNV43_RR03111 [Rhamnella rubrinervis]|uniref:Thaumatin-like protein n=1 Tax=Rhamnella rubrinervis TaxID=2594499 RepID=A0A8K0MNZ7_9ROSA|nr:hypothetical protein FNV43_RR03111 [Rhamnella rubrinervis]